MKTYFEQMRKKIIQNKKKVRKIHGKERKITLEKAINKVLTATKAIIVAEDFDEKERKYQYFCKNIMPLLAEILPVL